MLSLLLIFVAFVADLRSSNKITTKKRQTKTKERKKANNTIKIDVIGFEGIRCFRFTFLCLLLRL